MKKVSSLAYWTFASVLTTSVATAKTEDAFESSSFPINQPHYFDENDSLSGGIGTSAFDPVSVAVAIVIGAYQIYQKQEQIDQDAEFYKTSLAQHQKFATETISLLNQNLDLTKKVLDKIDEQNFKAAYQRVSEFKRDFNIYLGDIKHPEDRYKISRQKDIEKLERYTKLASDIITIYDTAKNTNLLQEEQVITFISDLLMMAHSFYVEAGFQEVRREEEDGLTKDKMEVLADYVSDQMIGMFETPNHKGTTLVDILNHIVVNIPAYSVEITRNYLRSSTEQRKNIFKNDYDVSYLPILNGSNVTAKLLDGAFVNKVSGCVYKVNPYFKHGLYGYNIWSQREARMNFEIKGSAFSHLIGSAGYLFKREPQNCDFPYSEDNSSAVNHFLKNKLNFNDYPELVMPVYIKELNEVYKPLSNSMRSILDMYDYKYGDRTCYYQRQKCGKVEYIDKLAVIKTNIAAPYDAKVYVPELELSVSVNDKGTPIASWALKGNPEYDYQPQCAMYRNGIYTGNIPSSQTNWGLGKLFKNETVYLSCKVTFDYGSGYEHTINVNSPRYTHTHESALDELMGDVLDINVTRNDKDETAIYDSSSNNFKGLIEGNVDFVPGRRGLPDQAIRFNGAGRIVFPAFNNYLFGSNFTVSLWAKRTGGFDSYAGLINTGYASTGRWEIRMGSENSGQNIGGGVVTQNDPSVWDHSLLSISNNEWHHIVMTYNGEDVRFFIDGVEQYGRDQQGTPDFGPVVYKDKPLIIGQAGWGTMNNPEYFIGEIDDIKVFSRAIELIEVKALHLARDLYE
ncbi:hypothetical protein PA25_36180 [Pseudoalteromonas sp. A25]|uniref:LamG domain-containing protein n=1 Tax=Pseudoalteromonas sp. A25 TaxID=116092 RepID=UPI001260DD78|nr:LamG domain-containing protein [Pseudoalteromonas sp. A25]BBN83633.1 hypothetical protein PA25_36180 [Pseudoalteromonas sp. A25]